MDDQYGENQGDDVSDGLMGARATCDFFDIGKTTLWEWTRLGLIESVKIRGSRRWLRRSVHRCAARHLNQNPNSEIRSAS